MSGWGKVYEPDFAHGVFAGVVWFEDGRWWAELPSGEVIGHRPTAERASMVLKFLALVKLKNAA